MRFGTQQAWKDRETIIDELEAERESEYTKTLKQFWELERVIRQFKEDRRFFVIRLYYFNETADGTVKPYDAPPVTWEDISLDVGKDAKTLRRWRQGIVEDMSICLFGLYAAV